MFKWIEHCMSSVILTWLTCKQARHWGRRVFIQDIYNIRTVEKALSHGVINY